MRMLQFLPSLHALRMQANAGTRSRRAQYAEERSLLRNRFLPFGIPLYLKGGKIFYVCL